MEGKSTGIIEPQGIPYLESIEIAAAVLEINEKDVNATDSMVLDNRFSYPVPSHRRIGCVMRQRDYMTYRYFPRYGAVYRVALGGYIYKGGSSLSLAYSSIVQAWKFIFKSKLYSVHILAANFITMPMTRYQYFHTESKTLTYAVRRGRDELVKMLPEREEVNHKRTTPKHERIPFPPAAK